MLRIKKNMYVVEWWIKKQRKTKQKQQIKESIKQKLFFKKDF